MRIHRANRAIMALAESHPLRRVLVAHDRARDVCVGREIEWPDAPGCAVDQERVSAIDGRRWTFSSFAYSFISYSLILSDWIDGPCPADQRVRDYVAELRRQQKLLDECEAAARFDSMGGDANERMLAMVAAARAFYQAYEAAFVAVWRGRGETLIVADSSRAMRRAVIGVAGTELGAEYRVPSTQRYAVYEAVRGLSFLGGSGRCGGTLGGRCAWYSVRSAECVFRTS